MNFQIHRIIGQAIYYLFLSVSPALLQAQENQKERIITSQNQPWRKSFLDDLVSRDVLFHSYRVTGTYKLT